MRWIEIGQIVKPHGLAGRVKVLSYLESDRLLQSLVDAWIGPSRDSAKRYTIENVRREGRTHFSLKIEGIEDRNAADALRGLTVSVPCERLETLPEDEYYWQTAGADRGHFPDGQQRCVRLQGSGEGNSLAGHRRSDPVGEH